MQEKKILSRVRVRMSKLTSALILTQTLNFGFTLIPTTLTPSELVMEQILAGV